MQAALLLRLASIGMATLISGLFQTTSLSFIISDYWKEIFSIKKEALLQKNKPKKSHLQLEMFYWRANFTIMANFTEFTLKLIKKKNTFITWIKPLLAVLGQDCGISLVVFFRSYSRDATLLGHFFVTRIIAD